MDNQNLEFFNLHQNNKNKQKPQKDNNNQNIETFSPSPYWQKCSAASFRQKIKKQIFPFPKPKLFLCSSTRTRKKKMHNQQRFPKISTIKIKQKKKEGFLNYSRYVDSSRNLREKLKGARTPEESLAAQPKALCGCSVSGVPAIFQFFKFSKEGFFLFLSGFLKLSENSCVEVV